MRDGPPFPLPRTLIQGQKKGKGTICYGSPYYRAKCISSIAGRGIQVDASGTGRGEGRIAGIATQTRRGKAITSVPCRMPKRNQETCRNEAEAYLQLSLLLSFLLSLSLNMHISRAAAAPCLGGMIVDLPRGVQSS